MFTTVLVAFDGSPGAKRALEAAIEFARRDGADLVGMTVQVPLARYGASAEETQEERELDTRAAQVLVEEAAALAAERGRRMRTVIRAGHPAREIVRAMLEKRVKVFFVTHMYDLAHGLHAQQLDTALFLRAERQPDGRRTFKLVEREPQPTSYGEDSYRRVFRTAETDHATAAETRR